MIKLSIGEATFANDFKLIIGRDWFKFKPHAGKKFVVLLVGEVDKDAETADVEAMLVKLGFERKP